MCVTRKISDRTDLFFVDRQVEKLFPENFSGYTPKYTHSNVSVVRIVYVLCYCGDDGGSALLKNVYCNAVELVCCGVCGVAMCECIGALNTIPFQYA